MAKCTCCGHELEPDDRFCPICREPVPVQDDSDITERFDAADVKQNKAMSVLAYLGILTLIPLFAAPRSRYVRFHVNQGLALLIIGVLCQAAEKFCEKLLPALLPFAASTTLSALFSVCRILTVVWSVMGLLNVLGGKAKILPFLGNVHLVKYEE